MPLFAEVYVSMTLRSQEQVFGKDFETIEVRAGLIIKVDDFAGQAGRPPENRFWRPRDRRSSAQLKKLYSNHYLCWRQKPWKANKRRLHGIME